MWRVPFAENVLRMGQSRQQIIAGADALATFRRDAFGMDSGKSYGFNMDVTLRIQVEAIAAE